jgi:hypothetical protein
MLLFNRYARIASWLLSPDRKREAWSSHPAKCKKWQRSQWLKWWIRPGLAIFMQPASCLAWQTTSHCQNVHSLGHVAAAEIISHIGARPEKNLSSLI